MNNNSENLHIQDILKILPHRFPFLLIDRILNINPGKSLSALKNISYNEPYFQGHFPEKPMFPGVLIIESIAQATGILIFNNIEKSLHKANYYLVAIKQAYFKYPVYPGDQMMLQIELIKQKKEIFKFKGIATVKNKIACKTLIICAKKHQ
ncbi:MAG: 3-hydroxy-acyl-[acyl-carrier-protein] dehydratase [Candidatus Westeberhardia cardiocondylae]|nr:3-hydroxy-acyl-[acyl-carrier-protein] dehydratase [Candidatus Westeberhardia cardiocondylae]